MRETPHDIKYSCRHSRVCFYIAIDPVFACGADRCNTSRLKSSCETNSSNASGVWPTGLMIFLRPVPSMIADLPFYQRSNNMLSCSKHKGAWLMCVYEYLIHMQRNIRHRITRHHHEQTPSMLPGHKRTSSYAHPQRVRLFLNFKKMYLISAKII